jgi:hypothetical protein
VFQLLRVAMGVEGTKTSRNTVEYVRVIGPSSMNRSQKESVWEGADYQLSFAFLLLRALELGNDKLYYQERKATPPEIEMLLERGVKVLTSDETLTNVAQAR